MVANAAETSTSSVYACVHDNVRIRADKSKDSDTIAVLPKESLCRVFKQEGDENSAWVLVRSGAYAGYVFNECLDYSEETLENISYSDGVVFLCDANVYTQPDEDSTILVSRALGSTEKIVPIGSDTTYEGFYQVMVQVSANTVATGWVKASHVTAGKIYDDAMSYNDFIAQLKTTKQEREEAQKLAEQESAELAKAKAADEAKTKEQDAVVQEVTETTTSNTKNSSNSSSSSLSNSSWVGTKLNAYLGTVKGPSGKETYYNLPMGGVISIMRGMGNTDSYWVRSDGCKMLGDYIMVAADLSKHSRGSLVETSLGTGIVVDTGDFTKNGSGVALDIATNW